MVGVIAAANAVSLLVLMMIDVVCVMLLGVGGWVVLRVGEGVWV